MYIKVMLKGVFIARTCYSDDDAYLISGTGEVYVNADPSLEYTQSMILYICLRNRRDQYCKPLSIHFSKYLFMSMS